jgi:hypothetical protein
MLPAGARKSAFRASEGLGPGPDLDITARAGGPVANPLV